MEYLVYVPETDNVALHHVKVGRANTDYNARDGYLSKFSLVTLVPENYVPSMLAVGLSVVIVPLHTSILGSTWLW